MLAILGRIVGNALKKKSICTKNRYNVNRKNTDEEEKRLEAVFLQHIPIIRKQM